MLPFLCEIALGCLVSYHVALLFLSREPRVNRNTDAPRTPGRHRQSGR
jgi:hypothetical protein